MPTSSKGLLALCAKRINELQCAFAKLSKLPGPQGDRGEPGARGVCGERGPAGHAGRDGGRGPAGKDGERGPAGRAGEGGTAGDTGPPGPPGPPGNAGERGPMPEHEWSGSKLRFQKPGGGWGAFVELCGPKGANGASGGFYSRPSGVGFDPTQLPLATTAVPAEFLVQQGGQWARATYAQMQAWFPGGGGSLPTGAVTVDGAPVLVNGQNVTVT